MLENKIQNLNQIGESHFLEAGCVLWQVAKSQVYLPRFIFG